MSGAISLTQKINLKHGDEMKEEEHKVKSRLKTDPFVFIRLTSFHNTILLSGGKKIIRKGYQ